MLKASDLRTGNLLEYYISADNFDWEIFTIDWQDIRECEEHNESFNSTHRGVNITENLLLNLGFTCVNKLKKAFRLYHNNENADSSLMILKEVGNNPIWVYTGNNRWTINPFTVELTHIHELQNLYFALTKNELTLKNIEL